MDQPTAFIIINYTIVSVAIIIVTIIIAMVVIVITTCDAFSVPKGIFLLGRQLQPNCAASLPGKGHDGDYDDGGHRHGDGEDGVQFNLNNDDADDDDDCNILFICPLMQMIESS